ncbi:MAG: hypothetical protein NVS4B2_33980 [Chloroflexota bacterium]
MSEHGNRRIQKFSPDGKSLAIFARAGKDTGNGRIQEFTSGGAFITQWRTRISAMQRQGHPTGLAVDRLGNIYVTDSISNRVQGFSRSHQLFVQWGKKRS